MIKTITSLEHSLVKHLTKLRLNRDYRHEHQTVIVAGIKPATELCQRGHLKSILVYNETFIPDNIGEADIYLVNEAIMKKVSGMQNPEGLLIEILMPQPAVIDQQKSIIVLDGINDPGNMGTLLRTALALGWDMAYVLENSCDPYNEKALRAARGATFRLPILIGNWKELNQLVTQHAWQPFVADLKGILPESLPKHKRKLLVLSNEAHGTSSQAQALCTKVTVPMAGPMESLNVAAAGAILMYLFQSQADK
jgi:TrmH family RNA methyltransferase